jgi:phosphoglycerol transferase
MRRPSTIASPSVEEPQPARRAACSFAGPAAALAGAVTAAAVALVAACVVLRVDRADLGVPFDYAGDALLQAAWAKTLLEQRWIHQNPALAAPFGQAYYDFALFEASNFLVQKALGWLGGGWAFAVNGYYLLTYPAAAACAYVALAALGVSALPAGIASVAYALLPYHFYRGEMHLFLAGYHFVPLAALVALWIARGDLPARGRPRRVAIAVVVMLLTAGAGIYYAFFTAWFLVVAALYAGIRERTWRPVRAAGPLLAILVLAGGVNVLPDVAYWRANGTVPVVARSPAESVYYGFRLASALLPIPDHRIATLAELRSRHSRAIQPVLTHDDAASSLGVVGSLGLLGLLALPFVGSGCGGPRDTLRALAGLAWAGLLLATTGGLGQVFAVFVTPSIRCWERIVPFLGFFALATVAIALDVAGRRLASPPARVAFRAGLGALGVVAVLDQTSPMFEPDYETAAAAAGSDRAFFGEVERALPAGAMVFQLPYVPFPEGGRRTEVREYDSFRPYLGTTALRWSYGAIRMRFADAWIRSVAARPVPALADALVLAGFRGIVVDTHGYADDGAALDAALRPIGDPEVRRSPDLRWAWYGLDERTAALRTSMSDAEWTARATGLLHPFYVEWQDGFYDREGTRERNLRWSAARSTLAVDNPRATPIAVRLTAGVCAAGQNPASLSIRSAALDRTLTVDSSCSPLDLPTTLPPGRTLIRFATTATAANAPGDPRRLHFRLNDFRLVVDGVDDDVLENR